MSACDAGTPGRAADGVVVNTESIDALSDDLGQLFSSDLELPTLLPITRTAPTILRVLLLGRRTIGQLLEFTKFDGYGK